MTNTSNLHLTVLITLLLLGSACSSGNGESSDDGETVLQQSDGLESGTGDPLLQTGAQRLTDLVIVQGQAITWPVPVDGGVPVRIIGLPGGLEFDADSHEIKGVAIVPGSYSVVIEPTGADTELNTYTMTIGVIESSSTDVPAYSSNTTVFSPQSDDIEVESDFYASDSYDELDALRVDIRTDTIAGECTPEVATGCTLADVNLDVDGTDDFKVEIPVHFVSADFPDDGSNSNAELRQRGATSRSAIQKSYRVKLDSKEVLWRNERRLQLNKHPFDQSRIRNKLAFDLMADMPHLPSLRTQFVNLWIDNGQGPVDYGLFTHVEAAVKEYLVNRNRDKDDYLYKIEALRFSTADLPLLALDEQGEPVDLDLFESVVEIKRGDNHVKLLEMITALNDPEQSFDSVFERYFNANNVLMWFTANLLMGQKDAIFHNFYLYNPIDSNTFYFLPWDYDAAFFVEQPPADSFELDDLRARLAMGYAKAGESVFLSRYLSQPGAHARILGAATELRNSYLSREKISQRASQLASVARPFLSRLPDAAHIPGISSPDGTDTQLSPTQLSVYDEAIVNLDRQVGENFRLLLNEFSYPLPPRLEIPVLSGGRYIFEWSASVDVTGGLVSHDLEVAASSDFNAGSIVFRSRAIVASGERVQFAVAKENLPSGRLFYRVTSRSDRNPEKYWQVPVNFAVIDGVETPGMLEFVLP